MSDYLQAWAHGHSIEAALVVVWAIYCVQKTIENILNAFNLWVRVFGNVVEILMKGRK